MQKQKAVPQYYKGQIATNGLVEIVDLFSGVGGMTLGALEALRKAKIGGSIHLALDSNEQALLVYRSNFSALAQDIRDTDITKLFPPNLEEDLTEYEQSEQNKTRNIGLLLAGPPCQGHSDLNNRSRRRDPRNKLYLSAIRAVKALSPQVAIIENVPTVIHDKTKVVERAIEFLEKDYEPIQLTANGSDFGLAQKRRRHLLILARKSEGKSYVVSIPKSRGKCLRDVIFGIQEDHESMTSLFHTAGLITRVNQKRIQYLFDNELYDLPDSLRPPCHRDKQHSYVSMYGRLSWDKPAQTITSGFGSIGQGRYIHPSKRRTITPHEAARIQGFPDFFSFQSIQKRTQLQTSIANAVPPPIIEALTTQFIKSGWITAIARNSRTKTSA